MLAIIHTALSLPYIVRQITISHRATCKELIRYCYHIVYRSLQAFCNGSLKGGEQTWWSSWALIEPYWLLIYWRCFSITAINHANKRLRQVAQCDFSQLMSKLVVLTGIPTDEEQATGLEKIIMKAMKERTVWKLIFPSVCHLVLWRMCVLGGCYLVTVINRISSSSSLKLGEW